MWLRVRSSAVLAFVFCCASVGAQQVLPPPLRGGPPSEVPVAVQILRWHMLDDNVSALAFRSLGARAEQPRVLDPAGRAHDP